MTIRERVAAFVAPKTKTTVTVTGNKPMASFGMNYIGGFSVGGYVQPFNGEKNLGEIGPIKEYWMAYRELRARSWQSYIESEITQTVIGRYCKWVIGSGLRLKTEPEKLILQQEGLDVDQEQYNELVERRWQLWSNSRSASVNGIQTLGQVASDVEKNTLLGGDCLVRMLYVPGQMPRVQIIDGDHVRHSLTDSFSSQATERGNTMSNGIEKDKQGRHVAFIVRTSEGKYERIDAMTKSGFEVAFMVYGLKYRLNDDRGIPLISVVLETLAKLERYKEATVGSAEERAKIPYFIKHEAYSDGSNPLTDAMAQAFSGGDSNNGMLPQDINGTQLADKVAATTNKTTFNMPIGATLEALDTKNDLYFKDFYSVNIELVCAAIGMPPEVAMSKFDSNFSASRAALKDWEHTLKVERENFANQFYKKVYEFWMFTQVFEGKIQAAGFIEAVLKKNEIIKLAYLNCRFVGDSVPHIDPLKEVMAERAKLGLTGANIPLTTVEDATETLNSGDSDSNMRQFSEELKLSLSLGIKPEPSAPAQSPT